MRLFWFWGVGFFGASHGWSGRKETRKNVEAGVVENQRGWMDRWMDGGRDGARKRECWRRRRWKNERSCQGAEEVRSIIIIIIIIIIVFFIGLLEPDDEGLGGFEEGGPV